MWPLELLVVLPAAAAALPPHSSPHPIIITPPHAADAPPARVPLFTHSSTGADGQFFPCVRIPTAVAVPGGPVRLAFAECRRWIGDGCEPTALPRPAAAHPADQSDRYICLKRSTDAGRTWGPLENTNVTQMRSTNPSAVWDLHTSSVRLFFSADDHFQNCSGIHAVSSTDGGLSWSAAVAQTVEGTGAPLLGSVGPAHGVISTRRRDGSLLTALASHLHHPRPVKPRANSPVRTFDTWVYTSVLGGDGHWRLARGDLPYIGETQ